MTCASDVDNLNGIPAELLTKSLTDIRHLCDLISLMCLDVPPQSRTSSDARPIKRNIQLVCKYPQEGSYVLPFAIAVNNDDDRYTVNSQELCNGFIECARGISTIDMSRLKQIGFSGEYQVQLTKYFTNLSRLGGSDVHLSIEDENHAITFSNEKKVRDFLADFGQTTDRRIVQSQSVSHLAAKLVKPDDLEKKVGLLFDSDSCKTYSYNSAIEDRLIGNYRPIYNWKVNLVSIAVTK